MPPKRRVEQPPKKRTTYFDTLVPTTTGQPTTTSPRRASPTTTGQPTTTSPRRITPRSRSHSPARTVTPKYLASEDTVSMTDEVIVTKFNSIDIIADNLMKEYGTDRVFLIILPKLLFDSKQYVVWYKNVIVRGLGTVIVTDTDIEDLDCVRVYYHFDVFPQSAEGQLKYIFKIPSFKDIRILLPLSTKYIFHVAPFSPLSAKFIPKSRAHLETLSPEAEAYNYIVSIARNKKVHTDPTSSTELMKMKRNLTSVFQNEKDTLIVTDMFSTTDVSESHYLAEMGSVTPDRLQYILRGYKKIIVVLYQMNNLELYQKTAGYLIEYLTNFPSEEVHIYGYRETRLFFFPPSVHRSIELAGFRDNLVDTLDKTKYAISAVEMNDYERAMVLYSDKKRVHNKIEWLSKIDTPTLTEDELYNLIMI